jgi:hypothetical protein
LLAHTFREAQKVPPKIIALIFVGIGLAPWIVLFGLVSFDHPHLVLSASKN